MFILAMPLLVWQLALPVRSETPFKGKGGDLPPAEMRNPRGL